MNAEMGESKRIIQHQSKILKTDKKFTTTDFTKYLSIYALHHLHIILFTH